MKSSVLDKIVTILLPVLAIVVGVGAMLGLVYCIVNIVMICTGQPLERVEFSCNW